VDTSSYQDLLGPIYPRRIILEFTSRCNLACAYCETSLPQYRSLGKDMDPTALNAIIDYLIEHKPSSVCVNGHGETTIYKDWHKYCNRLLDHGIPLGIITNLAKD
jgi:MoaA/NifB/PqqE/SkfB family radical SAM enzyme